MSDYTDAVLADIPVGYWRLGESSGSTAADASGNAHSGTYVGGIAPPTLGVAGLVVNDPTDTAAEWAGVAGYSGVAVDSVADIFDGTKAWTIEAWVNQTPDATFRYIFSSTSADPFVGAAIVSADSNLIVSRQNTAGQDLCVAPPLTPGLHHVVGRFDGNDLRVFVDGSLAHGPTASTRSVETATKAAIGNYAPSLAVPFDGVIDEVAVYDAALSPSRIAAHYSIGLTPPPVTPPTGVSRIAFSTAIRAAAVTLLKNYAADASVTLQVYRARPATVLPPCAFVDRMTETIDYPGSVTWRQRTPRVEVVVLHGIFDSGDAVDQRDRFVDGFLDWVTDNVHAADPNSTIGLVAVEDDPGYVNDWMKPEAQRTYYATRLTLEGFAGG